MKIAAALLLLLCCSSSYSADQRTLTWCLQHLPPRQYYPEHGEPYGPMVDFMRKLALQANFTLKFSAPTPTSRCLWLMQQGKTDLMVGLLKTDERSAYMWMWPLDQARPASLFTLSSAPLLQAPTDLRGKRVVLLDHYSYPAEVRAELAALHVDVVTAADTDAGLALLVYKQADVLVAPYHITLLAIGQNRRFANIVAQHTQLNAERATKTYLALSKHSQRATYADTLEHALAALIRVEQPNFYQLAVETRSYDRPPF